MFECLSPERQKPYDRLIVWARVAGSFQIQLLLQINAVSYEEKKTKPQRSF